MPEVLISTYTSTRRNRIYHTDHRCGHRPDEWVLKTLSWVSDNPHDWRECRVCRGNNDNSGINWSYQNALKDADTWDDLSLGDGGESA